MSANPHDATAQLAKIKAASTAANARIVALHRVIHILSELSHAADESKGTDGYYTPAEAAEWRKFQMRYLWRRLKEEAKKCQFDLPDIEV